MTYGLDQNQYIQTSSSRWTTKNSCI